MNALKQLNDLGQAFWMDFIRRKVLTDGEVKTLIADDGLSGMTSNPTIFDQAIGGGEEYDEQLHELLGTNPEAGAADLLESLEVRDIQMAADLLRVVYDRTGGGDGYISLEVPPDLAHETERTIEAARHLWERVKRPNLMIKVPATPEGIPAIRSLLGDGINVNVTLMFSLAHYEKVANAYLEGLGRAAHPERLASVASIFVSRIDTKIDDLLDKRGGDEASALRGMIAIANAKMIYRRFQEIFSGPDFAPWRDKGARVQRVLWASTSTKDPAYRDVRYVEELIGPETVNTMPPKTFAAFRDHGRLHQTLTEGLEEARSLLDRLAGLGIDLDRATEELQDEGVDKFEKSYNELLATLERKRDAVVASLEQA